MPKYVNTKKHLTLDNEFSGYRPITLTKLYRKNLALHWCSWHFCTC